MTGTIYCVLTMHRHLILGVNPGRQVLSPCCKGRKEHSKKLSDLLTQLVWYRHGIQTEAILILNSMLSVNKLR